MIFLENKRSTVVPFLRVVVSVRSYSQIYMHNNIVITHVIAVPKTKLPACAGVQAAGSGSLPMKHFRFCQHCFTISFCVCVFFAYVCVCVRARVRVCASFLCIAVCSRALHSSGCAWLCQECSFLVDAPKHELEDVWLCLHCAKMVGYMQCHLINVLC